jgi:O-antigen/teichoic acid export membrane protein
MALVLLHFAKNSGPTSYGELSFYLVLITYSAFAVFGINASYVKHYSINKTESFRNKLTVFNFWYNFVIAFLVFTLIFVFVTDEGAFALALICCLNLVRGSIQSICRAELKVWRLSIFNAVFSIFYLIAYYCGVVSSSNYDVQIFLSYWALSLAITILLGTCLIIPNLINMKNYSKEFIRDNFSLLLKNAIALFVINFGNTILLSSDRMLLNIFDAPLESVGYYQFADNIASIFYLGSNSLLFLLVPVYMRKLSDRTISVDDFKSKFLKFGALWLAPLLAFILIAYFGIQFFFVDYQESLLVMVLLTISKFICLFIFVPVTVLTTFHYERVLMKTYYSVIIPMLLLQMLLIVFMKPYWLLPVVTIISVVTILCLLWNVTQKVAIKDETSDI